MRLQLRILLLSCLLALASVASAAGLVDVSFVKPSTYTDAGKTPWEKDANLHSLEKYLQTLGSEHLRRGEILSIEILDVDLAGTVRPWSRTGSEIRVIKGSSDWPRISLRYTLSADGKTLRSDTVQVADLDYSHGAVDIRGPQPLQYEKKMLSRWFVATFGEKSAPD